MARRKTAPKKMELYGLTAYDLGSSLVFINPLWEIDIDEDDLTEDTTVPLADRPLFVVPARREVCGSCEGTGTTTRHIECDGGGFTSSEWAEMCDGDPDFAEDYLSGRYDRPCDECNGANVVPVPDLKDDDPKMAYLYAQAREEAAIRAEEAAERRYFGGW